MEREREPRLRDYPKDKRQTEESNFLPNLEVVNETRIPPVESAHKSGCGRCG